MIFSCLSTKNHYDIVRFKPNRFSIKPNTNQDYKKHIDTSAFYVAIIPRDHIEKYKIEDFQNGIKFYGEGRLGHFKGVDFTNAESFNPEKAIMGYYNFNGEDFYIEKIYSGPSLVGSRYHLSLSRIIIEESTIDTLVMENFENSSGRKNVVKYTKKKLPQEFLVYKPDW